MKLAGTMVAVTLGMFFTSSDALAAAQTRANWSVAGGETVGSGADVLSAQAGWPDVTLRYVHGMSSTFDLGAQMQLIYGFEYGTATQFGLAFAMPLRWTLARRRDVSFLLHLEPGVRFYTTDPLVFGLQVPWGLTLEFRPARAFKVGVGLDFNSTLFVTGFGTRFGEDASPAYFFGPMAGPWFEYQIDPHLLIGLDTRFGVVLAKFSGIDTIGSQFAFRAQALLGYRL